MKSPVPILETGMQLNCDSRQVLYIKRNTLGSDSKS